MSSNIKKTFKVTKNTKPKTTKSNKKVRTVPRQDSPHVNDPRNTTLFHPDQVGWSWTNLPGILYQLNPEGKSERGVEVPLMEYSIHGKLLRDLPVLPDNISSAVEEFRVETWMRLDRRIHLKDITDRMHPLFRVNENALQQRGVRFRQSFHMIAWDSGNKRSRQLESDLLAKMVELGVDPSMNSTRGITPGLIDPSHGEEGGRIPLPEYYSEKGRFARGRKPKTTSTQTQPETQTHIELQTQTPAELQELTSSEHEVQMLDFVNKFVPFDEFLDHEDGALPVIRGEIPDDELPLTIFPQELDLSCGIKKPTRRIKTEKVLRPIGSPKITKSKSPSIYKPSTALSFFGFCHKECNHEPMISTERLTKSGERLQVIPSDPSAPEKLRHPSNGIYPLIEPVWLESRTPVTYGSLFDRMLEDYHVNERCLAEMAFLHPFYEAWF